MSDEQLWSFSPRMETTDTVDGVRYYIQMHLDGKWRKVGRSRPTKKGAWLAFVQRLIRETADYWKLQKSLKD